MEKFPQQESIENKERSSIEIKREEGRLQYKEDYKKLIAVLNKADITNFESERP